MKSTGFCKGYEVNIDDASPQGSKAEATNKHLFRDFSLPLRISCVSEGHVPAWMSVAFTSTNALLGTGDVSTLVLLSPVKALAQLLEILFLIRTIHWYKSRLGQHLTAKELAKPLLI